MTRVARLTLLLLLPGPALTAVDLSGHTKFRYSSAVVADGSSLRPQFGDDIGNQLVNLRLNTSGFSGAWSTRLDYEVLAQSGDTALALDDADDRRLWDLSGRIDSGERSVMRHRLDRLWVAYTVQDWVLRLGRQALSWGNGLVFNPVDFINPFDPLAVDTEYKRGSDMFYAQRLLTTGDDVQLAWVGRRDDQGDSGRDTATLAMKYHGIRGVSEFDVLLARHGTANIAAVGYGREVGEALWRSDVLHRDTEHGQFTSVISNLSYSWVYAGRNISGVLEWFYNGVGVTADRATELDLAARAELQRQLVQGEVYNSGRHYLAGVVDVEVHPLLRWSNTLYGNLSDQSVLWQSVLNWNAGDNSRLTAAIAVPVGSAGTEFGGRRAAPTLAPGSIDSRLFVQWAFYF